MHTRGLVISLAFFAPASFAASVYTKRDLSPPASLPGSWTYEGCYSDNVNSRELEGATYSSDSMTVESCISYCSNAGYTFAGTEYSSECYCGYGLASAATSYPDDCTMACSGDSSEPCGGPNRLSVYHNGGTGPTENPGPGNWQSLGCFTDSQTQRTLSYYAIPQQSDSMTVSLCTSTCAGLGYHLAGVEYAGECYCGHSTSGQLVEGSSASAGCNMPCKGDSSEFCGGSSRMNLYYLPSAPPAGWFDLGCYSDSASTRILGVATPVPGDYNNMTVAGCLNACNAAGYQYAGLEYARECYCDAALQNGATLAPAPDHAVGEYGCNMFCTGDGEATCGGQDRAQVYHYTG